MNPEITGKLRNVGKFKKGNQARKGSKNPNAGRPSTDIREYFKGLCDEYGIAERLVLIACNEAKDDNPFPPDVQLKAMVYLLDRAHGKAPQSVEVSGKDGQPLVVNMVKYGD